MPQTSYSASAECIKKARIVLLTEGLTQNKLADSLEVSLTTVNRFFRGEPITAENFIKICKRLGLVVEDTVLGIEPRWL